MHLRVLLSILLVTPGVTGYLYFADKIPNGKKVPHPCKANELWEGVGHFKVAGTGSRNPFGVDFDTAGKTWTRDLCRKDSDGDGRTNGQELGDPDCTWAPGTVLGVTSSLSHPGVCEPTDSVPCLQKNFTNGLYSNMQDWMAAVCKYDKFVCEGLDAPEVKKQTLRLESLNVPAQETTYMCKIFDFAENNQDVHLIATTPYIDNRNVMHHIVMFGCDGEINRAPIGVAYQCGMAAHQNCTLMLGIWTVGQNGECYHKDTGVRMGLRGLKRIALQFHWNNPQELTNYNDSSGMTLYYTPNRRPNDAAILMIGDQQFTIPPGEVRYSVESSCTSACTRNFLNQSIYITAAWNHMHYAGISQTIQHIRNGQLLKYITNDNSYSYDSPLTYTYNTPIEVLPGDELKTTCYYNTENRAKTVLFGESTQEEMCFGFIYYYPKRAVNTTSCVTYRSKLSLCDNEMRGSCQLNEFLQSIERNETTFTKVTSTCEFFSQCMKECKDAIREVRVQEPCMRHEVWWGWAKGRLSQSEKGIHFMGALASCESQLAVEDAEKLWNKSAHETTTVRQITTMRQVYDGNGKGSAMSAVQHPGFVFGAATALSIFIYFH